MGALLYSRGLPFCLDCHYCLAGLPHHGTCPGCGTWYELPAYQQKDSGIARCRRLFRARSRATRATWLRLAMVLIVLGNTAIVVSLAAHAWRTFIKAIGFH